MDPNRHHEFTGGNEERQSAMYFNRGMEESRTNTQYYPQERVIVNNKSCMCPNMSNNISCNACPSTADGNWNSLERTTRVDFQSTNTSREKVNQNPIYVHDGRQYYHPNSGPPTYGTEVIPANRNLAGLQQDRNSVSSKSCALESNYNFKQQLQHPHQQPQQQAQPNLIQMQMQSNIANVTNLQPQQLQPLQQQRHHQHVSAIGNYSKESLYDEKYSSRQDMYKDVKVSYSTIPNHGTANTATMYGEVIHNTANIKPTSAPIDIIRNNKVDPSNIINPSNSLALKEQQASPNYGRKCPQIFTHGDHGNTQTTHQSLYMSTPQFSSDKFTNIHAQRKIIHEPELKVRGCTAEVVKMNEMQMSSLSGYTTHSGGGGGVGGKYHHQHLHEPPPMQQSQLVHHHQEPILNNISPALARSQNYYMPSSKSQSANVSEMSPISAKQAQIPSQYSKSPKALPSHPPPQSLSHPHHLAKGTNHELPDFKKKDDIYNEPMIHPNSGLYANPYKTSSPIDTSCCKDIATPYVNMNFVDQTGAQHSYYKYGKLTKETVTKNNNLCTENQNTPPPTPVHRSSGYKTQPYFYETQHIKYDGNVHNTPNFNMSPSVAAVASPSPSQTTPPSHIQMHHTSLTPQSQSQSPANYTQMIRHPQHNQIDMQRTPVRTHYESGAAVHPTANFCAYERQPQNSKTLNSHPATVQPTQQTPPIDPPLQSKIISNLTSQAQKQNTIKKTHVPKTNYRELINQVYAMRNATSEKELDLQIIKKALNSATGPGGPPQPVEKLPQSVGVPNNSSLPPLPINPTMSSDYVMSIAENGFLLENAPTPTRNLPKICVDANLPDIQRTIKVEEPLSSSPLDLSMRTVKTKADSTEYCYNQALMKNNPQIDYKHALPRVDFTPNFSLHSDNRSAAGVPPKIVLNQSSQHMRTTSEVPKSMLMSVNPKAISAQSQTAQHLKQYPTENTSRVCTGNQRSGLTPLTELKPNSSLVAFKASDESVKLCQIRPSVVETNPFATVKSIKSEPSTVNGKDVPAAKVEHFKNSTNILPLSKPLNSSGTENPCATTSYCGGVIKTADQISLVNVNSTPNSFVSTHANEQRNPNYLGRKRHLQEYSNSQLNEPSVKQQRYQERESSSKSELIPMTKTTSATVIAVNKRVIDEDRERERDLKTVAKSMQAADIIPTSCQRESSIIISNNVPICKTEPLTPTMSTPSPTILLPVQMVPIKTETNSVIAARIRTKAELKGFTFNTPLDVVSTIKEPPIQIKEEPNTCQTFSTELPSIPGLDEAYDSSSLLDFSWNNKCTDFMEQLLTTNSQKKYSKRRFVNNTEYEMVSNANMQMNANDAAIEQNTSNVETTESSKSGDIVESMIDSAMRGERTTGKSPEGHSSQSTMIVIQKKISKQDREKMRFQQEKRIAARLQVDSSSESDDEIHKRKSDRSKKPLKKAKVRQNTHLDTNQFSDCGSDSSDTNDERKTPTKANLPTNDKIDPPTQTERNLAETKISTDSKDKCQSNVVQNIRLISDEMKSDEHEDLPKASCRKSQVRETNDLNADKETKQQDKATKVSQHHSTNNKEEIAKGAKKPKVHLKVGLNTMTRSKLKREMELQLANSKVLRNDKIIRNSTTKIKSIKRKYVRKFVNNQSSVSGVCKELSNKQSDREPSMRLRSRNEKLGKVGKTEKVPGSSSKKILNKSTATVGKSESSQNCKAKGKERQSDLFLEVYRYKRSLKIPPNLITIEHPHNLKMAASLPDLEGDHDTSMASTNRSGKFAKSIERLLQKSTPNISEKSILISKTEQEAQFREERRSIIDVLHSRVIKTNITTSAKPKIKKSLNSCGISSQVHSDVSHSAESSSITEMLSIPLKKELEDESSDLKKRHFSIFETTVLKSKTRTESKMQQRKEIIREIFVGDDRPASAPPEIISQMSDVNDKMTFEQKYEQFLQHYIVINDDKLRKNGKTSTLSSHSVSCSGSVSASASTSTAHHMKDNVKDEEDMLASNGGLADPDASSKRTLETDTGTSSFRRRRPGKYLRRKGSSGFDYIRKKKKPNSTASLNVNSIQNLQILARLDRKTTNENHEKKVKTEGDVRHEISKWVLNKSVGQSTMHKAARLGYIDVVVYCLDRMGMNPDQKDNAGYTPLHEACTKGWLEIARILLQYGANHSEAAHSGIRPLHEASENDHEEIVRLLLSYGADPLLATYSGQTPLMLASSTAMRDLLNNHLSDVQNVGPDRKAWHFKGPWKILDSSIYGYDIFGGAPNFTCDMSRALRKSSVSNSITNKKQINSYVEAGSNCKTMMENCAVVLDNIDRFNSVRLYNDNKPEILVENSDSEGEMFEFEEADILLPPLYLLKDEGTDKWVLLSDLCNLLKVKSKDTLLNKIYPPSSSSSPAHKSLMRELKMSDFLERATCLQLLCAGEKINICASKVVLIKYNDSVRNLLGVKTILMKF